MEKYYLGTANDKYIYNYCLAKHNNGIVEIVDIGKFRDEKEFKLKVNEIAKQYNAILIEEK